MCPGSQPTWNRRMRNNLLLSQWSGSNPVHFAALIIHSHWITFSLFQQFDSTQALFPFKNFSSSPGNREEHVLRQNQWILRTFRWWKYASVLMNVLCSHWLPVCEYFQPLCSFLSVVGLSLPNLLLTKPSVSVTLFFCFSKIAFTMWWQLPTCGGTTYIERDVSLDWKKIPYFHQFMISSPLASSATGEFLSTWLVRVVIQPLLPKGQLYGLQGRIWGGRRIDMVAQGVGVTSVSGPTPDISASSWDDSILYWLKNCCDFGQWTAWRMGYYRKSRDLWCQHLEKCQASTPGKRKKNEGRRWLFTWE